MYYCKYFCCLSKELLEYLFVKKKEKVNSIAIIKNRKILRIKLMYTFKYLYSKRKQEKKG